MAQQEESSTKNKDVEAIDAFGEKHRKLREELGKVIIGQEEVIESLLISIFSRGHCLLVGVPGLAKTLLVNSLSQTLGLRFDRIQFTPDLMPSDIIGAEILDQNREFKFIKGPIFANIILADEINRTPPKTQSALLEAMQELAVTTAGRTFQLDRPFFVLATQNPIEQEGTYPLPEAQLDRFMFNIRMDYPSYDEEVSVVKSTTVDRDIELQPIITAEEILEYQELIRRLPISDHVLEYCVGLASATRPNTERANEMVNEYLSWGAGPRASQFLVIAAKCHAALHGKYAPDEENVKAVALPILRHRVVRNYKAAADGYEVEDIIQSLL